MSIYRLRDVLNAGAQRQNGLTRLMGRIEKERNTLEVVRSLLPQREASHCIGASVKGDTLVVLADSASWASRLRFQCRYLVDELHHMEQFAKVQRAIIVTNATVGRSARRT